MRLRRGPRATGRRGELIIDGEGFGGPSGAAGQPERREAGSRREEALEALQGPKGSRKGERLVVAEKRVQRPLRGPKAAGKGKKLVVAEGRPRRPHRGPRAENRS